MGIAFAINAAGRHMSPEVAAELDTLRARVAELDVQRQALAERLSAGQTWQRGRSPELVSENYVSQSELRAIFGIPLAAPWADEARQLIALPKALSSAGEHEVFVHHDYRTGRDLPESGGGQ